MASKAPHIRGYRSMPATLQTMREDANRDGWSWTLNRDKAVWFAKRFSDLDQVSGLVLTGVCKKTDVYAYLAGRQEAEIIVNPEHVRIVASERCASAHNQKQPRRQVPLKHKATKLRKRRR